MASVDPPLFEEICSADFLNFEFNGRAYADQLSDSVRKTQQLSAITVTLRKIPTSLDEASAKGKR
jgi:hypothetical protein